ncbi:reverse transcriptase [Tanacetum coccineum]
MLFRTRCTISNHIFDFIIDGGSCENIISRDLVHKMKLPVEKHLEPYSIVWITDGAGIRVTKRCRVPLSIGKFYKDEVMCDVVDMNACHLLFGHPWQYDLETIHDVENLLTVSRVGAEFMGDLKDSKEVHLLIVKEFLSVGRDESTSKILDVILQLLSSFHDIMPEELPNELPPMRDIQHAIDLVPEASLPNLPHYRMNLKESALLQQMVEELLQKGLICVSMSPCAVPALLTPKKDGSWCMCVDSRAINKITVRYRFCNNSHFHVILRQ